MVHPMEPSLPIQNISTKQIKRRSLSVRIRDRGRRLSQLPLNFVPRSTLLRDNGVAIVPPIPLEETKAMKKSTFLVTLSDYEGIPTIAEEFSRSLPRKQKRMLSWAIDLVTKKNSIHAAQLLCTLLQDQKKLNFNIIDALWESNCSSHLLRMIKNGEIVTHKEISMEELTMDNLIGHGAVGKVHTATFGEDVVAVKVTSPDNHCFVEEEFRFEVGLMSLIDHPNILQCIGATFGPDDFFILSEYQDRGDLRAVLNNSSPADLSLERKTHIATQVASGLYALHSKSIVHRDIKAENILVNYVWDVVVADFGSSRIIGKGDRSERENMIGTSQWMAPEMWEGFYDEKVDVYSFGILLFEIFTTRIPYAELETWDIADYVLAGKRPVLEEGEVPERVQHLMELCWRHNPKQRPSFKRIFSILESWREIEEIPNANRYRKRSTATSLPSFMGLGFGGAQGFL